ITYQTYGAPDSDYKNPRWGGLSVPDRFTGKEDDTEVGLTYFGARYYQPQLGRFVSPDPLAVHGLGGDPNVYAYVRGRATMAGDPWGLNGTECDACSGSQPDPVSVTVGGGGGGGGGGGNTGHGGVTSAASGNRTNHPPPAPDTPSNMGVMARVVAGAANGYV